MNGKKDFHELRYDDKLAWLIKECDNISSAKKALHKKLNEVDFYGGYACTPWHLMSEKQKDLYMAYIKMLDS